MFDCVHSLKVCLDENDHLMDAHFMMGFLYEKGIQVEKNLSQAFEHYSKASELGHVKATTKRGHFYYSGIKSDSNLFDQ